MAQRQFKSTDTSKWIYGFGKGTDGAYSSTGNATDAPIDSACTGTADSTSLSATNASFASGQLILIHQTRGTANVGKWELNRIASYTAGTITLSHALINTYAALSQVIVLKQYSSFTQNTGHTLTVKQWNGTVGGIIAFLCNGTTTITGTLKLSGGNVHPDGSSTTGGGFRGATSWGDTWPPTYCKSGEGSMAASTNETRDGAGNAGGGGQADTSDGKPGGSGGGGNGGAGSNGTSSIDGHLYGYGGEASGNAALTIATFGGGSGSATTGGGTSTGADGGGWLLMITKNLAQITGSITLNGGNGDQVCEAGTGGGGGGSCLIKAQTAVLGTNKITATGGTGASGINGGGNGGAGGTGRIHLDYLTSTSGTTNPTLDSTQDLTLKYLKGSVSSFML